MKNFIKAFAFIASLILFLSACEEYNELTAPGPVDTGSADFSSFVTIGNAVTAGYQSGSLYQSAQQYSYGKLIANVMGISFTQPLVADPGTSGRLEVESLDPFTLYTNPNQGAPLNLNYPAPYNNLGIPGAFAYDVLNATNSTDNFTNVFGGVPNPMFDLILRNSALQLGTQIQQAAALSPTFIILWIGWNDVLGFATSGGTSPDAPTDQNTFNALYNGIGATLAANIANCEYVVGNIPDIQTLPFFTTVGPQMSLAGVPGIVYQQHGETGLGTGQINGNGLLTGVVLITLKGSSYAGLIGQPTGQFYRDFGFPGLPPGIDTTQAFGVTPQNPWPDALILDPGEITTATTAVTNYNNIIATLATGAGYGLADFYSLFNSIRATDFKGGTIINGIAFTTMFVTGGIFSLDGVHPTSQGQAIIANQFITATNDAFDAKIPLIDVSTIPGSLNFAGKIKFDKHGYAIFPAGAFDHLFF